jgi:large conductance mechanosensitive channel
MNLTLVEAKKAGAVLAYGNFITILLNFLILAFIIFQMVRLINKAKTLSFSRQQAIDDATPAAPPSEDIVLLREIRDALRRTDIPR